MCKILDALSHDKWLNDRPAWFLVDYYVAWQRNRQADDSYFLVFKFVYWFVRPLPLIRILGGKSRANSKLVYYVCSKWVFMFIAGKEAVKIYVIKCQCYRYFKAHWNPGYFRRKSYRNPSAEASDCRNGESDEEVINSIMRALVRDVLLREKQVLSRSLRKKRERLNREFPSHKLPWSRPVLLC